MWGYKVRFRRKRSLETELLASSALPGQGRRRGTAHLDKVLPVGNGGCRASSSAPVRKQETRCECGTHIQPARQGDRVGFGGHETRRRPGHRRAVGALQNQGLVVDADVRIQASIVVVVGRTQRRVATTRSWSESLSRSTSKALREPSNCFLASRLNCSVAKPSLPGSSVSSHVAVPSRSGIVSIPSSAAGLEKRTPVVRTGNSRPYQYPEQVLSAASRAFLWVVVEPLDENPGRNEKPPFLGTMLEGGSRDASGIEARQPTILIFLDRDFLGEPRLTMIATAVEHLGRCERRGKDQDVAGGLVDLRYRGTFLPSISASPVSAVRFF